MSPLLPQLIVIFSVSVAAIVLCHRLRAPPVLGLLLTGILVGPDGTGVVSSSDAIHTFSEVGIILLLFSIGTEFSLRGLFRIKRSVFFGGALQVALTTAATYILARTLGASHGAALLLGFLISLSSTALVLKILRERAEIDSLSGKTTFAILLFQDLAIVPMMLVVPVLSENPLPSGEPSITWVLAKGILILVSVLLAASWLIPKVLRLAVGTEDREVFLLTIMAICFSVASLTEMAGLSLSLGALLAGLIVSESEYSHYTIGAVIPFQQVFITLFFVSVGMLLDLDYALSNITPVLLLSGAVMIGKACLAVPAALVLGLPLHSAVVSALALAQIGEFSFILAETGLEQGILSQNTYQLVLSASILTIAATPLIIRLSPSIAEAILKLPIPGLIRTGWLARPSHSALSLHDLNDHTLIVGFGITGKEVSHEAELRKITYVVLEVSVALLKEARREDKPVFYGDASHNEVLTRYGIERARVAVVTVSEPTTRRRIVSRIRDLNPHCYIVVRSHLSREVPALKSRGADEVIVEELEVASSLSRAFLARYHERQHRGD